MDYLVMHFPISYVVFALLVKVTIVEKYLVYNRQVIQKPLCPFCMRKDPHK